MSGTLSKTQTIRLRELNRAIKTLENRKHEVELGDSVHLFSGLRDAIRIIGGMKKAIRAERGANQ